MDLPRGSARVYFRDGEIVHASYDKDEGTSAFFGILQEKEGRFKFKPVLPDEYQSNESLGDFMWLLMEGVRVTDEAE